MQPDEVSRFIIQKLEATAAPSFWHKPRPMSKAISALLPYAAWQERHGRYATLDAISHAIRVSEASTWNYVVPTLLNGNSPRTTLLASHHTDWLTLTYGDKPMTSGHEHMISQWAAAVSAVPYTEEIGQSVVHTLLSMGDPDPGILLPHVPIDIWALLEKQPSLPPDCHGRTVGTQDYIVRHVRALGDIKVLKSYLLLVWSEWDRPFPDGVSEMCISIRSDFSGSGMRHHREDLIKRLDHVIGQLDRGLGYIRQHKSWMHEDIFQEAKVQYRILREALLEVGRAAM